MRSYARASKQWSRQQKRLANRMKLAFDQSEKAIKKEAVKLSSGKFKLPQLAKMGYPYATRVNRPPADTAIINVQSGFFRSAWFTYSNTIGNSMHIILKNPMFYAVWLSQGTRKMISRQIVQRLHDRQDKPMRDRLERALTAGLKF